jgi:hypothetical protein
MINLIHDLRAFKMSKQDSQVEFSRREKFVVCGDDYRMSAVSPASLKKQLDMAKMFVKKTEEVLKK